MPNRPGALFPLRLACIAMLLAGLACPGPRDEPTPPDARPSVPATSDASTPPLDPDGSTPDGPTPGGPRLPGPPDGPSPPSPPDGPPPPDSGAPPPACEAPASTSCPNGCVDTGSDPRNCGACGTACASFQTCAAGRCSPRYEVTVASGTVSGVAWDLALAPDGAMFAAGIFKGTVDFDPGPSEQRFTALGEGDVFVTKFDAAGAYQWTRTVASSYAEPWVHAIGTPDGGVVLSGPYRGSATFFAGEPAAMKTSRSPGVDEGYILKIAGDGSFGFVRTLPATGYSVVFDVESLHDGSLLAVGPFAGPIDYGDGDQNAGLSGGFALRLSSTGMTLWARSFLGTASATVREGPAGAVALAGGFMGKIDLDPGPGGVEAMSPAGMSLYAIGLDSAGLFKGGSAVGFGGATEVAPRDIAFGSDGAVYVAGDYQGGAVALGADAARTRPNAGAGDAFVVKFSPAFVHQWGRSFGGAAGDYAWSLSGGPEGVLVAGKMASDRVDFGGEGSPDLRELAAGDLFVVALGPGAEPRGVFTLGPPRSAVPLFLRATPNAFLLGGFFSGTIDFDPRPNDQDMRTAAPIQSAFVSRYVW